MTFEMIVALVVGIFVALIVAAIIYRKLPKKLKSEHFHENWKEVQKNCKDKNNWPQALKEADHLLDTALKKRKYNGKTMGERMVSAQRTFSNNDAVWFAHNLAKKVIADPDTRLKEADVKSALIGFRQALRDIGALSNGESRSS